MTHFERMSLSLSATGGTLEPAAFGHETTRKIPDKAGVQAQRSDRLRAVEVPGNETYNLYRCQHSADLLELDAIWATMEKASAWVMALSLWELGYLREPGERITADDVAARCCSVVRYRSLMSQWLAELTSTEILARVPGSSATYSGGPLDVARARQRIDQAVASLDMATDYPGFIEYFKTCVSHQTDLLTGAANPQKLLFPAGSSRIVDGLYQSNPASAMHNRVAAAMVQAAYRDRREPTPIRILEIGAGTGATTSAIVSVLPTVNVEYRYTDISRFFLRRAARTFAGHRYLTYELLDIDRSPLEQGFERNSFDVIVAANVLHTAKHVDHALKHLESLLSDSGIVVAIETTSNTALQMITFGHFEGVCHFQDHRRYSNLPFLSCSEWQSAFRAAGLQTVASVPAPDAGSRAWMQHVLLGARGSA